MARKYRVRKVGVLWSIDKAPSWIGRLFGLGWHEHGTAYDWHQAMTEARSLVDVDATAMWLLGSIVRRHGPHVGWRGQPDLAHEYGYAGADERPEALIERRSEF